MYVKYLVQWSITAVCTLVSDIYKVLETKWRSQYSTHPIVSERRNGLPKISQYSTVFSVSALTVCTVMVIERWCIVPIWLKVGREVWLCWMVVTMA